MKRRTGILAALAVAGLGAAALFRGGLLDLPSVPRDLSATRAGLAGMDALAERARDLETASRAEAAGATTSMDAALQRGGQALARIRNGDALGGLKDLRAAVALAPDDLVLGNAYRMEVFRLRRRALTDVAGRESLAATMPDWLEGEPIQFLESLVERHPSRETRLQLALSWVDEMLLYPALEIKAPASVESVNILSGILASDPYYVPALYGRGLNYLHRPARLVWPEGERQPRDGASQDLGRCIAAGRKVGGGSPQLVAHLALALGDAYAKEGKPQRARSWWQIAQNQCRDAEIRDAVARRFSWSDSELLDALEDDLEGRMLDLEHPMTDLAMVWG